MRPSKRQRGSALLFTLLATVAGALVCGLAIDTVALLAAKARLQTMAELAADAARRNPGQGEVEARKVLVKNGLPNARVEIQNGLTVQNPADVFFMTLFRQTPVTVAVRVETKP
ncbi:MAG: hypothetical protein FJW30_03715 [Acidobacteria bacterium]|nr:hypothetical protein [Acidobacteriota bacterium]